jgi:hypothetical protein
MNPMTFLFAVLGLTGVAWLVNFAIDRRRVVLLSRLASEYKLHFSRDDRFNLAGRVAERLPTPGAADVKVIDLIYGMQNDRLKYVFTAEYTQGTVRTKRRVRRVAAIDDAKGRAERYGGEIAIGDAKTSLIEQYRALIGAVKADGAG